MKNKNHNFPRKSLKPAQEVLEWWPIQQRNELNYFFSNSFLIVATWDVLWFPDKLLNVADVIIMQTVEETI